MPYSLFREPNHFFYRQRFGRSYFYIRSVRLEDDATIIHRWVNKDYALRFWQMQGSLKDLIKYYNCQRTKNITSSFFVCHGTTPIALFEVYQVVCTELRQYYEAENTDYGIHLLMAPHEELLQLKKKLNHISEKVLLMIVDMLFSFASISKVVAEPDSKNIYACRLAEKAGFKFVKKIKLPEKLANFYSISREDFKSLSKV